MKKLFFLLLFMPLATLAQITTTVFNIPGVGNVNAVRYYPINPTAARLLTLVEFPGSGESGSDPSKAYLYGPLYFVKNKGFAPSDMQFIFIQTPYSYGTFNNPIAGAFVRGALDYVHSLSTTDTNRLFITGYSYGADHTMFYMQKEDAAHYIPIAGIIPMSMNMYGSVGNSPNDKLGGNDIRFNKTPIYAFCGNADNFLTQMQKFAGYANDATRQADPTNPVKLFMKLDVIKGAHNGEWNIAYDPSGIQKADGTKDQDIYTWMRSVTPTPIIIQPSLSAFIKPIAPITTDYVFIDGSATTGTVDSVNFSEVSGPSKATLIYSTCSLNAAAVGLVPGQYTFKMIAYGEKTSSSALVSFTINPIPIITIATIPLSFTILNSTLSKTIIVKSDGSYIIQ